MSSLVGGTRIIGQDMVCGFSNGKYKTFEGTEISIENCLKAKVKDLVVEGKTIQDTEDLSNIESVAEREKNLVNTTTIYESMLESGTIGSLFNPKSNSAYDVYKMEIQPNTEYLFNLVGYGQTPWVRILDKNNITVKAQNLSSTGLNYIWSLKTESNFYYLVFNKPKTSTGEFKIYKEQNPYPLKLKINEENNYINLPIPLRSLPNGVADTIEGNKLVQRIGKVTLDGTEEMGFYNASNYIRFTIKMPTEAKAYNKRTAVYAKGYHFEDVKNEDKVIFSSAVEGANRLYIYNYDYKTVNDFKAHLTENPLEVYYELAEPVIHSLEVPSISTSKGTNIITTTNNIKPKISMKVKVKK